jgi:hypothetical protein
MSYVIYFIVSDTFADHIPNNQAMGGERKNLGTEFAHEFETLKECVNVANKLIFLTTGKQETVFDYDDLQKSIKNGVRRVAYSNDVKTHHCELLFNNESSKYDSWIKKGIAQ